MNDTGKRSKPSAYYVSLGTLVRYVRTARGMTRQQLADAAHCDFRTLGCWETATRRLPADMIMPLCDALKVTPEFLLRTGHLEVPR